MADVLVISKDKNVFEEFNITYSDERNNFEYADSATAAIEMISMEIPDLIYIIEMKIDVVLSILTEIFTDDEIKKIPVICLVSAENWSGRQELWERGVKDILQLPVSKEELKFQIGRFTDDISDMTFANEEPGMQGKLDDYNLLDLIQTLESNHKTGVLILYHSRDEGKIWFEEGDIRDANYRTLGPVDAILKMSRWSDGDFSITFLDEKYEKIIEAENEQILLNVIQHIDDRNKILKELPPRKETLLISPEADMDQMEDSDVVYLRFFHGGQTIVDFLDMFDEDDLKLLGVVKGFVDNQIIMTREAFDHHQTEQERQAEGAGLKKAIKKLFKRKDAAENEMESANARGRDSSDSGNGDFNGTEKREFAVMFYNDNLDLKKIKSKLAKI
ncbi:MAG: DUF4388 domain-containing protein [Calditrichales bacterium]|nr:MAG: DUF4388 domain-containing protein [Calditrichales bacterium]